MNLDKGIDELECNSFLLRSRTDKKCDICKRLIPAKELHYDRGNPYPTIRCLKCHSVKHKEWKKSRVKCHNYYKEILIDLLFNPSVDESEIIKLCKDKQTLNNVMQRIKKEGYIVTKYGPRELTIVDIPQTASFLEKMMSADSKLDMKTLYGEYKLQWNWIFRHIMTNSNKKPIIYETNNFDNFYEASEILKELDDIEYYFGDAYRYSRISFDDNVYKEVCQINREYVFSILLDRLLSICTGIEIMDDGEIEFNGRRYSYGTILDESQLGEPTGCDIDIIILECGVECLIDNEDNFEILSFVEYFDQQENVTVNEVIEYMTSLRGSGF